MELTIQWEVLQKITKFTQQMQKYSAKGKKLGKVKSGQPKASAHTPEAEARLRWDGRTGVTGKRSRKQDGGDLRSGKDRCVGSRVTRLWPP